MSVVGGQISSTWRSRAKNKKHIETATDELQNDIDIIKICTIKMVYIFTKYHKMIYNINMTQYELWHNVQPCTNMTPWFYILYCRHLYGPGGKYASLTGRDATRFLGKNSLEEASDETFDVRRFRGMQIMDMGHQSVSLVVYISLVRNKCLHNTTCKKSYYTKHQTYHYILQ